MYTFQSINVDSLLRKIESATENAMRLACKTGQGCKVGWWAVIGLLWLFASTIVYGACTAPPALLARVKNQPTAENYSQLGSWFGGRKQFACAADAYSSAVKIEPDSASLNFMLGLSLFSAGQDNKAIAPLLKSARLNSNDVRPHLTLGAALDRLKEIEAAESEWRAALAIDPDSESALDGLSQDLLAAKDYNSVIALLGKPSGVRVRSPLQSLNLGSAYAAEARLDEAAAVLREGLNTAPDSLQIADQLGLVLMLMARVEEAYAVFDLALEKHPRDQHTQLLYLRVLVTSHSDKAPQLAHKVLEAYPDNWDALYLNAVLEDRDGDDQQARTHLNRSVARNPNDSQSQEELGSVLAKLGDLPGAKEHLEKAIALGDVQPEVQYALGKVLQRLGDVEHAKEALQKYQQLKTARSEHTQAAGKAEVADQAMAAGNFAQAAGIYREAIASYPTEASLYYKLSRSLDKINDIAGEKDALLRAIQLNPNLAEAQNQMGYLTVRSGDPVQAESYFQAAIQASPSYVAAWNNLAATLASEARWQDARQALDHALAIDPGNVEALRIQQAIADAQPKQ